MSYVSLSRKNSFYIIPTFIKIRFDGVYFSYVASTRCDHNAVGLANYKEMALTTGTLNSGGCGVKSELYDFNTNQWNYIEDFPFAK